MVRSLTLIQAFTHLNLLLSLFSGVIDSSLRFLQRKQQKKLSYVKKHTIYGPGVIFVSVLILHVNGTVSHRHESRLVTSVGSPTETKSDWSEFIFKPVPCITKRMKRNV